MVNLEEVIQQIKTANPFMGKMLDCDEPLLEHAKNRLTSHNFLPVHVKRQAPYKKLIKEKADSLFQKEDVRLNLDGGLILDTTDHHSLLNFPTTIGAHIISSFDTILNRKDKGDYFVLNCGKVPFADSLQKRGIKINGKHLNLYPKKDRNKLVSKYSLYTYDLMDWVKKSKQKFTEEELKFISRLQEIIDNTDFSTCTRLSDQIVKINYHLWIEMFGEDCRDEARRCLTIEHDEILVKHLIKFLVEEKDNIIWKALFDESFREVVFKEFKGVYGAWDYRGKEGTGTHFFWCFCEDDGKEYKMELKGEYLVSPEEKVRDVKFCPEDVSKALEEGILVPSIFLKFSLVSIYMGIKIMGGPGQTEYTGKIQQAWFRVLEKLDKDEFELAKNTSVLNFNVADIAFRKNEDGKIFKEWGMDMVMNHRFTRKYIEDIGKIPFKYFLYPMIPISYYWLTPAEKREEFSFEEEVLYKGFKFLK